MVILTVGNLFECTHSPNENTQGHTRSSHPQTLSTVTTGCQKTTVSYANASVVTTLCTYWIYLKSYDTFLSPDAVLVISRTAGY